MPKETKFESRQFLDPAGLPTENTPVGGTTSDIPSIKEDADRLSLVPVAGVDTFVPKSKKISSGTDSQRDLFNRNKSDLNNSLNSASNRGEQPSDVIAQLQELQKNIGRTTTDELKQIEQAGSSAGAAFDAKLGEATERRRRELPSDIVRAGERGGFENTQFAGTAAVTPTDPFKTTESFVGAGGILSQQRQLLDRNVSLIRAEQQRAINAAKSAQREYNRTGKQQDFDNAKSLVTLASQLKQNEETLQMQRERLTISQAQEERAATKAPFELAEQIADIVNKFPLGEEFVVDGIAFVGTKPNPADKPFFTGSNIISLMGKIPAGETLTIPDPVTGTEWNISGTKDPDTTTATDDQGNVSIINKNTGEIISRAEGVGKTKTRAPSTTIILNEQQAGILGEASIALEASIGEDGFFNTDTYIKERNRVATTSSGDVKKFDEVFKQRLNPEDPQAKRFLSKSEIEVTEGEKKTPAEEIAEKLSEINIVIE